MQIETFFDEATSSLTYLVRDGRDAIVIDPVRDYEPKSGRTSWASCERVAAAIAREGLRVAFVLDTHVHADHLTGLPFFRERHGARSVTGARVGEVQRTFRDVYHLAPDFPVDGSQFDVLLDEGKRLRFGSLEVEALASPGHTPAHVGFRVGDAVFVGDTLFQPDYGTARCDFPGGDAGVLWDSIQRLYALPPATRLFTGHDYQPGGRALQFESSVAEQRRANVQCSERTTREEFIAFRRARDATLAMPVLILPAVQVNIRAGELPEPEANGVTYLKIPVNRF
jgi:glyoxylase-like metal-dependent hydrolase (beta-lactamase superfamily II)